MHATETTADSHNTGALTELFTSGAYVEQFQPEARLNPFRADYASKRAWVVDSVNGHDQRILDVGGAMGRMAIPLARRHNVTLCDLSPQMLQLARHHFDGRLNLAVADVRALPFKDAHFDYALCIDVLPHLPTAESGVREIRRVLRVGGTLIIDSTNSQPFWTLAYPRYLGRRPQRWLRIWRSGGVLPEWSSRVRHMRLKEFVRVVTTAGFRVRSQHGFGPRLCPKWHVIVAEAV
jgi:glycogen(starch) synthase